MENLFKKKRQLEQQVRRTLIARCMKSRNRVIPYREVSPLIGEIKNLDAAIDQRRRSIANLVEQMLREIEELVEDKHLNQLREIVRPARMLAGLLYQDHGFPWKAIKRDLRAYQKRRGVPGRARRLDFVFTLESISSDRPLQKGVSQ